MPNANGFEFLETYSKLSPEITNSFSPIIVILSNHINPKSFTKGKDFKLVGVECILKKPLDREDLEDVLEESFNFKFD
jgi:response regulator RpfG family c-di-GMP phosphodiesterase